MTQWNPEGKFAMIKLLHILHKLYLIKNRTVSYFLIMIKYDENENSPNYNKFKNKEVYLHVSERLRKELKYLPKG